MAFRGASAGAGGLPGSMGYGNVPGLRGQAGQGAAATSGGSANPSAGAGAMPGFPALSQGRPLSNQSGGMMGVGRGVAGGLGTFGINGLAGAGGYGMSGSHQPTGASQGQQNEASLDPSDFPALGGAAAANAGGAGSGAGPGAGQPSSYAAHVNTPSATSSSVNGPSISGGLLGNIPLGPLSDRSAAAPAGQRSDFSSDDFPALDGAGQENGREAREQASAAAALNAQLARMPGAKVGGEVDKRNYATKLSGPNAFATANHQMNGVSPNSQQQQSLLHAQAHAAQSAAVFRSGAPAAGSVAASGPGADGSQLALDNSRLSAPSSGVTGSAALPGSVPQTPAQQVLFSPADRFGLLGLLQIIKHSEPDMAKLTLGMDLTQLGLDVGSGNNLYSTFMTPWSDPSQVAAANIEPDYHLPSCYNVSPPTIQTKIGSFHDESLLWVFYNQPRDVLQELAAAELYRRNWRYHKELQTWLTKQPGVEPHEKNNSFEKGEYIFFDTKEWRKVPREYTLVYAALEAKPAFTNQAVAAQAIATLPTPTHPPNAAAPSSATGVSQQAPGRTASAQGGAGGGQSRVPSGATA